MDGEFFCYVLANRQIDRNRIFTENTKFTASQLREQAKIDFDAAAIAPARRASLIIIIIIKNKIK